MEANTSTSTAPATLPDLLRQAAKRFSKHRAILFGGRTLDYASFDGLSDRFAGALAAQGIVKGDRVGLYCVNSDAFAIAYFGIIKAGATVVPINLLLNPKEIAFILADAGAKALIYHEAFGTAVQSLKSNVQSDFRSLWTLGLGLSSCASENRWYSPPPVSPTRNGSECSGASAGAKADCSECIRAHGAQGATPNQLRRKSWLLHLLWSVRT